VTALKTASTLSLSFHGSHSCDLDRVHDGIVLEPGKEQRTVTMTMTPTTFFGGERVGKVFDCNGVAARNGAVTG
jgi:hypothetical protein